MLRILVAFLPIWVRGQDAHDCRHPNTIYKDLKCLIAAKPGLQIKRVLS